MSNLSVSFPFSSTEPLIYTAVKVILQKFKYSTSLLCLKILTAHHCFCEKPQSLITIHIAFHHMPLHASLFHLLTLCPLSALTYHFLSEHRCHHSLSVTSSSLIWCLLTLGFWDYLHFYRQVIPDHDALQNQWCPSHSTLFFPLYNTHHTCDSLVNNCLL